MKFTLVVLISVLPFFITSVPAYYKLTILHTNEFHSAFEEEDGQHGVARMVEFINREKRNYRKPLYLNAGNVFSGSLLFFIHKAKIAYQFVNMLNFDAMVLGFYDYYSGDEALKEYCKNVDAPILCANCDFSNKPWIKEYVNKSRPIEVSGMTIGIIGFMEESLNSMMLSVGVRLTDEITALRKEVGVLRRKGAKIIVALGQAYDSTSKKIAKKVDGIDAIITGRDTSFLYNGTPPIKIKPAGPYPIVVQLGDLKVPIAHVIKGSKFVGKLVLEFEDGEVQRITGNPVHMSRDIQQNRKASLLLSKFLLSVKPYKREIVGATKVPLSTENCLRDECNLGNVMADAYVDYKSEQFTHPTYWTDTAIGMFMSDLLGDGIYPGKSGYSINKEQLYNTLRLPEGKAMSITLNGSSLRQAIEHSATFVDEHDRFMQFSGVHVIYDLAKPRYQRIMDLTVRCAMCEVPKYVRVEPKKRYRVIVTDLIGTGLLDYRIFKAGDDIKVEALTNMEFLIKYLQNNGVIMTGIEERITVKNYGKAVSVGNGLHKNSIHVICIITALYMFLN